MGGKIIGKKCQNVGQMGLEKRGQKGRKGGAKREQKRCQMGGKIIGKKWGNL